MRTTKTYVSTYCNFPHRMRDGSPIRHECRRIPVAALDAEIADRCDLACDILAEAITPRRVKNGWRTSTGEFIPITHR